MGRGYRFIIGYGPGSTKMYGNRTVILTNEYSGSACTIGIEQAVEPPNPWELVDPNATAKTANMSFGEIFSGCLARDVCANKTSDEADACLRSVALSVGGDAHCCFGLSTAESTNSCILTTAGQSHGISEDYCQFLPSQPERDECYFAYGDNYYYYGYCTKIANSSMKDDCLATLLKVGAPSGPLANDSNNSSGG